MLVAASYNHVIDQALREDLGSGDITTDATVPQEAPAFAVAVAKSRLVVCGGQVFLDVFARADRSLITETCVADGELVTPGTTLWTVSGRARSILTAERVALNLAQRMSGIATLARAFVDEVPANCHTRIADTRKTTPGLRALERYAVRTGGAHNHRDNLSSAVLIKDNHIVASGGISSAVKCARALAPHCTKIEVEVEDLAQLREALACGCEIIMLDNFSDELLRKAVAIAKGKAILEVSGGVRLERIRKLAELGVDVISVGALTHSAPAADISLDFQLAADS